MEWIEIFKAIILGIIEGITEWLPVSSTGHMILVDEFLQLGMSPEFKEMFFVVIQLGAIMAVVLLYWKKIFPFNFNKKPFVEKDIIIIRSIKFKLTKNFFRNIKLIANISIISHKTLILKEIRMELIFCIVIIIKPV